MISCWLSFCLILKEFVYQNVSFESSKYCTHFIIFQKKVGCYNYFRRNFTFLSSISFRGSLRFNSVFPNRHTFKFPSAVSRSRLHDPQKCWVIEVMNPIRPKNPMYNNKIPFFNTYNIGCLIIIFYKTVFIFICSQKTVYLVLPMLLMYHYLRLRSPYAQNLDI